MNTFRRPMFRGGPVDSRGTGITSGLSYNKGGRVGYQPGGQVTGGSIMDRIRSANSLFFNDPARFAPGFDRTQPKTFLGMNIPGTGMAVDSEGNPISIPQRNFAEDLMFVTGPGKFLKAGGGGLQLFKEMGKRNIAQGKDLVPFKEAPFLSNQYFRNILQPYTSGMKETLKGTGQSIKDFGIIGALGLGGGTYGLGKMYEGFKERQTTKNPLDDEPEEKALTPDQIENIRLRKLIEDMTKVESKAKDTDMEESIDIDKEKFAKALGRDKARGQDISDMLLSFSSKALAPDATVKSAFAEFAADEVKRPSRVRKIDDSAAALAINKYIKGEISRAEADQYIKRIELTQKLRDESNKKTAAEYIQAADEAGFVKKVKVGLNSFYAQEGIIPKYEVVKSKDMDDPEKFKFSQDDVGVIFIEEDTREVYTFDSTGTKQPIINM